MSKKLNLLASGFLAQAQNNSLINPGQGFVAPSGTAQQSISGATSLVVNLLFILATILAIVYLIIGGVRWITSRGDKNSVEAARKQIVAAIIGLVVVAAAFFILNVVFGVLGVANPLGENFSLPTLSNPNPTAR